MRPDYAVNNIRVYKNSQRWGILDKAYTCLIIKTERQKTKRAVHEFRNVIHSIRITPVKEYSNRLSYLGKEALGYSRFR